MRDVSNKSNSLREARAEATLRVSPATLELVRTGRAPKGDPYHVARVAGIQAAKNTPSLLPYCHPIPLDYVAVDFAEGDACIRVLTSVKAVYKTGVEMEALSAAAAAVLCLYDMLKPVDSQMEIASIRLVEKSGGVSQMVATATEFSFCVIVVSDRVSGGQSLDRSGALLRQCLTEQGGHIAGFRVVPDDIVEIQHAVSECLNGKPDLIVTTGGTGLAARDVTPEAVIPLLETRLPGIEYQLSEYGRNRFPAAMLGRPFAGKIDSSLVLGLPGSPNAVEDAIAALFPQLLHAFVLLRGRGHE